MKVYTDFPTKKRMALTDPKLQIGFQWMAGLPTAGGNKGANFLTLIQEVLQLHTAMLETMKFTM